MKRLAAFVSVATALVITGTASAASLVPLAGPETWASTPIFVTAPPGDQRVFIVERGNNAGDARIMVAEGGVVRAQPFLTVNNVDNFFERGLLSMAFAPDYATSGLFYLFYTADGPDLIDPAGVAGDIRVVEGRRSAGDPNLAEPLTQPPAARLVLKVPHSAGNHNGGWMAFGPDGLLYLTIGDNANGPNAQDPTNLLGKVVRINPADPDGGGPLTATIPAGNPFVGEPGTRGEIYTYGLRNPYRASFAPDGSLTIGDVGQSTTEEINAGSLAGRNMGWPSCEGFCNPPDPLFTDPVFDYSSAGADCAVVGGHVVRDPDLTGLTGRYLYGDYCSGDLRTLGLASPGGNPGPAGFGLVDFPQSRLLSFGEDSRGCSYVITSEAVYRVAAEATDGPACPRTGPPPGPPPGPGELPDVTFNFYAAKSRPLARKVNVAGECSIACDLTAGGTVRISRNRFRKNPGRVKLLSDSSPAAAGVRTRLNMRIPSARFASIRKAARNGSRIVAYVKTSAVATDGTGGSGSGPIRLTVRKRR